MPVAHRPVYRPELALRCDESSFHNDHDHVHSAFLDDDFHDISSPLRASPIGNLSEDVRPSSPAASPDPPRIPESKLGNDGVLTPTKPSAVCTATRPSAPAPLVLPFASLGGQVRAAAGIAREVIRKMCKKKRPETKRPRTVADRTVTKRKQTARNKHGRFVSADR